MNCTALLFLNEVDDNVCGVFKLFLKSNEDDMFLMFTKQTAKVKRLGVSMDFRGMWLNFMPKIYATLAVIFMLGFMYF